MQPAHYAPNYVRLPSMNVHDADYFVQLVGMYNRGLITRVELVTDANRAITDIGPSTDRYHFNLEDFRIGAKIALEPYFHSTMPDRITFRMHFVEY